jgi:hypothetical protein
MWRQTKILLRAIVNRIMRLRSDKGYLSYLYSNRLGVDLNWDTPSRLTEKINLLKLKNKHNKRVKFFADKFYLRTELKDLALEGYLVPLISVYDSFSAFELAMQLSNIQSNVYIKLSNDCGSSIWFSGKNQKAVLTSIRNSIKNQKKFIRRSCEYQYDTMIRIMVEKNVNSGTLYDVKVFLSRNLVMQVMCSEGKSLIFLDQELSPLNVRLRASIRGPIHPCMDELPVLELKKISSSIEDIKEKFGEFEFCRVDMITNIGSSEIFINEVTFSPSSGLKYYLPESYDFELGEMVEI